MRAGAAGGEARKTGSGGARGGVRRPAWVLLGVVTILGTTVSEPAPTGAAPAMTQTLIGTPRNLGTLSGYGYSAATAVSGKVIVGRSSTTQGAEHAFAFDAGAATPKMQDLGALPGRTESVATAVDGHLVVGNALSGELPPHAFAYDLDAAGPRMLDLGTLPGDRLSQANAVDGKIVVGYSYRTGPGVTQRAFAYDLGAATPQMLDLGRLTPGAHSEATAVDGKIVVGSSGPTDEYNKRRAFAYDLRSATPRMRDLGTLGGTWSSSSAVSGNVVVGTSETASGAEHAFAYDLGAAVPKMQDLGTLPGGVRSQALGVDQKIVVGSTYGRDGQARAFAYDLGAARPSMRNLGTLGGPGSEATAVDGKMVVGVASQPGGGAWHAFAYDLDSTSPQMTDLGPSRSPDQVVDVSGDVVAGTGPFGRYDFQAVAWRLTRTRAPALRFAAFNLGVRENTRRATVTVIRTGDPRRAVSVRYAAGNSDPFGSVHPAVPGEDFRAVSGTLRFAAGQTRRSFTVPIINDKRREPQETILVTLKAPTGGAVLGTPNVAGLIIRTSDQQPDALISTRPARGYIGNNVYNTTGRRQTKVLSAGRARTRSFYVRVYNDGNMTSTFTVRGSAARPRSTVRYYSGTTDATRAMRSHAGWKVTLNPHASKLIRVQIAIRPHAASRSRKTATIRATWRGDGIHTDLVKAVVRVRAIVRR